MRRRRAKVEKKLEAFTKEYDPSKNLSRKTAEIEKDIADLDKELDTLASLDPAASAELKAKRDSAVASAKTAVGGAVAGKAQEDLEKKFVRVTKDFDPATKNLASVDSKRLEAAKKELDDLIAKLDADAKATWTAKRDELFATIQKASGEQQVGKLRERIVAVEPVAPLPGIDAIKPMTPTWCEGVLESYGKALESQRPTLPDRGAGTVTEAILFSCLDPEFDVRQKNVAAWRQNMSNDLRLTAAQNERLLMLGRSLVIDSANTQWSGMMFSTATSEACDSLRSSRTGASARGWANTKSPPPRSPSRFQRSPLLASALAPSCNRIGWPSTLARRAVRSSSRRSTRRRVASAPRSSASRRRGCSTRASSAARNRQE